jgi:hypothetical protein
MGCGTHSRPLVYPGSNATVKGVSLRFLRAFQQRNAIENAWTTADVVDRIVKPQTEDAKISYSDFLKQDPDADNFLGDANCMISHAWGCSFNDTVEAIESHVLEQTSSGQHYVLLDIFHINQHKFGQVQDKKAIYDQVLRQLTQMVRAPSDKKLVLCIDNWEDPVMLNRAWVSDLYEQAV